MQVRPSDVVTVAVLGVVSVRLLDGLRHSRSAAGRSLVGEIVRGIRWRHVWPVPCILAGVLVVAWALWSVPPLRWGWWSAVGGQGNPVFGSSDTTAGTVLEWLLPALFVVLLVPALPLFAYAEECIFRRGAEGWTWPRRVGKAVQFGLVHAIIGIPVAVALALSVAGGAFMHTYLVAFRRTGSRREATLESTRGHTAYNAVIIVTAVVAALA